MIRMRATVKERALGVFGRVVFLTAVASGCGDSLGPPDAPLAGDGRDLDVVRVIVSPTLTPSATRATVYFQAADSSLVLATRVDDAGHANAFMPSQGFVTVVERIGSHVSLYTYTGVRPGDVLFVHPILGTRAALTVRAPERPPGTSYEVLTACGDHFSSTPTTELSLNGCEATTDVLVMPDSSSFSFADDVALGAVREVSLPSYRGFEASTLTVVNAPDSEMMIDHGLAIGSRIYSSGAELTQPTGGVLAATRPLPLPAGSTLRSFVAPQAGSGGPAVLSWQPAAPSIVVDYAAAPRRSIISSPSLATTPLSVRWEEASAPGEASAFYVQVGWQQTDSFRWEIVAPSVVGSEIALPVLPIASLRPTTPATVEAFELQITGDAADGLTRVLGTWQPDAGRDWPITGDTGRVAWRRVSAD